MNSILAWYLAIGVLVGVLVLYLGWLVRRDYRERKRTEQRGLHRAWERDLAKRTRRI